MEHVVVVVGLTQEEANDGGLGPAVGCLGVLEDGWGEAAVCLISVEVLGPNGLVICPPGGEDPGMGSGFDEFFGNLEGGSRGVRRMRGKGGVGGMEFGCAVDEVPQGMTAVSRDPIQADSDSPGSQGVEGSLDGSGFHPVHVGTRNVGGADVDCELAVREYRVAGRGGMLAWWEREVEVAVGEPLGPGVGGVEVGWEVVGCFEDHFDCCGDGRDLCADVGDQDSRLESIRLHGGVPVQRADHAHTSSSSGGREGAGGAVCEDDGVPLRDGFPCLFRGVG